MGEQVAGVLHDPAQVAALWNVCGAQYRNDTSGELMPRIMSTAVLPSSTKSSGWGSSRKCDALALEHRQQFLHGAPELALAAARLLGPAVELGVHDAAVELDGDLDRALPVAHRRLPLVLVRARPAVQRQDGRRP